MIIKRVWTGLVRNTIIILLFATYFDKGVRCKTRKNALGIVRQLRDILDYYYENSNRHLIKSLYYDNDGNDYGNGDYGDYKDGRRRKFDINMTN